MQNLDNILSLESLEFFAKNLVEGFITGKHKSPYHGFSVEFAEHRLYNKWESTKHVDWKLFGRTDKLFVKKYEDILKKVTLAYSQLKLSINKIK